ncbi:hypothetical protein chiPu_0032203, partial [Chiloscyllium punctatum]|nr:hypothetical protein [Chiloscyllium punctatum]
IQHNAGAAAADVDDRSGDVVIPGIQDGVGGERAAAAGVERQRIAAIDDRAGADREGAQRNLAARRRTAAGILPGNIDSADRHRVAIRNPQQRTVAAGKHIAAIGLFDRQRADRDVTVGAAGHRADRPDDAAVTDDKAPAGDKSSVAGERDKKQLGPGQRMRRVGQDLEIERAGGDVLHAVDDLSGAADQHRGRPEPADL